MVTIELWFYSGLSSGRGLERSASLGVHSTQVVLTVNLWFKRCSSFSVHSAELSMAVVVAPVCKVLGTGWTFEGSLTSVDTLMGLKNLTNFLIFL